MAKIKTLKDSNGETFYPQTHIKAVVDSNGNSVDVFLNEAQEGINRLKTNSAQYDSLSVAAMEDRVDILVDKVHEEGVPAESHIITIPAATTESAGVMSAEDKNALESLPIRLGDVNVIELEQSQFSNLIWNGTKFLPSTNNYNSYILRIPEQTPLKVSSSVGAAYNVFKESPYIGYSTQDFINITNWADYPQGLPSGYRYLVITLTLSGSSNYDVVVTIGEHGLGKRISTLSKKIDEEIVPNVNKVVAYETEATFNTGYIVPKNGGLPITDNSLYVHALMDCIEGQRFIVSAKATALVFAWQFLDDSNNILTKYEGGTEPVVEAEIVVPFGAKKFLVNSTVSYNPSVKFWNSNIPETVLSKEIKETVGAFDSRITDVEDEYDNIKGIVGEPSSAIDLTASDYSGLLYNGTAFLSANANYDSFIFPLTKGVTYQIINNTDLSYAQAGITTVYTFSVTPVLGNDLGYVRKLESKILESFTPQDTERYLVVNITKSTFVDKSFTYIAGVTGLLKRVEELENNPSKTLQGKTILCLGDSITEFAEPGGEKLRYSDYLERITGAKVYNGGFGGTLIGRRADVSNLNFDEFKTRIENSSDENDIKVAQKEATTLAYACLDLSSIAYALATGGFDIPEAGADWFANRPATTGYSQISKYTTIVGDLSKINLNEVDIITIFMGTNNSGSYLGEVGETQEDDTTQMTMCQGFEFVIRTLLTAYPHLRIYYFSPMPRYFADLWKKTDGVLEELWDDAKWCDNYELNLSSGKYTFTELVDKTIELAKYYKIPVCDMYRTLGINKWNIRSIMGWENTSRYDGSHPYRGFKMLANKIASFIVANNNSNI